MDLSYGKKASFPIFVNLLGIKNSRLTSSLAGGKDETIAVFVRAGQETVSPKNNFR